MHVLIQDGRVHDVDVDPALGSVFTVVDVTGLAPQPAVGWLYDGHAFSDPPAPAPIVRTATNVALLTALDDRQRAAYPSAVAAWDQRLMQAHAGLMAETEDLVARVAAALGTSPQAWFDAALKASAP